MNDDIITQNNSAKIYNSSSNALGNNVQQIKVSTRGKWNPGFETRVIEHTEYM